ncbi:hypothetical protein PUNSTDRAFT_133873 [Punctularia strigosozonata HHB-11173 SS5]|uniref:uncharacterized protein n=1 Tax=Punctularia strigosozonata (strain HHB-11173) TaxID=741275 RepID=UPI00044166CE|nr:uncharacterized protein PUNSTDRAFT_133873 [Punctularia strigosozonata HHB-11173 SS5]EIN10112.1 hypothetical protein PUNSTDRAFT_133873 [Punctularia strigosozonata HHB-11173 SS5]
MISHFTQPVLNLAPDALQEIDGGDAVSNLWIVFSRCKDSLQDGERLENISWRLWYRELASHDPSTHYGKLLHRANEEQRVSGYPFPSYADDKDGKSLMTHPTLHPRALTPDLFFHVVRGNDCWERVPSPSALSAVSSESASSVDDADPPRPPVRRSTSTSSVGKIICDMLPEKVVYTHNGRLRSPSVEPHVSRPRLTVVPEPVISKLSSPPPASTTTSANNSAPGSLAPKVVVVNPTPHPTPPATPVPMMPPSVLTVPPHSPTDMLPPPRNAAPTPRAMPPPATASLEPALAPGVTVIARPTPTPAKPSDANNDTLKASERRFFLKQSPEDDSPDRQSGDALSPRDPRGGGSSVTSEGTSVTASSDSPAADEEPTTKAPSAPPKRVASATTVSSGIGGHARGRKGKEPIRALTSQRRPVPQRPGPIRRATTDVKTKEKEKEKEANDKPKPHAAFKIGSTSSNGSKSRTAAKMKLTSVPKADVAKGKGKAKSATAQRAAEIVGKRGIVVDSWSDTETETDDDSDWASEDVSDAGPSKKSQNNKKSGPQKRTKEELEAIRLREAAEEAQRQRDLFAKLPKRSYSNLNRTGSGLLSMLFHPETALAPGNPYARAGFSSDDVVGMRPPQQPEKPSRGEQQQQQQQQQQQAPPRRQASAGPLGPMARLGMGMTSMKPPPPDPPRAQVQVSGAPGTSLLKTSKSAAALPTVTATPAPAQLNATAQKSGYRPKGRPEELEMEDDSDSAEETGGISKSLAQRKLEELANGRRREKAREEPPPPEIRPAFEPPVQQHTMYRSQTQPAAPRSTVAPTPVPLPAGHPYNLPTPAAPTTPRTTRRQMLATELSESLRRNLLWERQVSMINMVGPRKRPNALGGGLRPLTTTNGDNEAGGSGSDPQEEARKQALARNKSWADDYHYAGW